MTKISLIFAAVVFIVATTIVVEAKLNHKHHPNKNEHDLKHKDLKKLSATERHELLSKHQRELHSKLASLREMSPAQFRKEVCSDLKGDGLIGLKCAPEDPQEHFKLGKQFVETNGMPEALGPIVFLPGLFKTINLIDSLVIFVFCFEFQFPFQSFHPKFYCFSEKSIYKFFFFLTVFFFFLFFVFIFSVSPSIRLI